MHIQITWKTIVLACVLIAGIVVSHKFMGAEGQATISSLLAVLGVLFVDADRTGKPPVLPVLAFTLVACTPPLSAKEMHEIAKHDTQIEDCKSYARDAGKGEKVKAFDNCMSGAK